MTAFKAVPEYREMSKAQFFDEIVPQQRPIIIREYAKDWPLVVSARKDNVTFARYMMQFYTGEKARMAVAPPQQNKRFYYNADMTGINYLQGEERVDLFLGRLLELIPKDTYPAISMQNALIDTILPGLSKDNPCSFFSDIPPRLWLGNEGIVSAHYDGSDNLACVVAGRRQFILFPPEQTKNLYPGPLNFTPAGAPTTLVDFANPDYERFPLFSIAMDNAYGAELGPGDAIFIPMLWWHHVESLEKVNGLMNYWWSGSSAPDAQPPSAIDSLNIALLAMRDMSNEQKKAWRYLFDHYLFKTGVDPTSYIPQHQHHLLGEMSPEYIQEAIDFFAEKMKRL